MKGEIARLHPCHTCLEFHHSRVDHLHDCGCLCHTVPEEMDVVFTDTNVQHYRKCPHCRKEFPILFVSDYLNTEEEGVVAAAAAAAPTTNQPLISLK